MSELQRLKSLLPPENESWVFVEAAAAIDPPLITLEEIGRDEVEIQIDLDEWDNFAIDHRNLLFWHEVGKIQNDTICLLYTSPSPRDLSTSRMPSSA